MGQPKKVAKAIIVKKLEEARKRQQGRELAAQGGKKEKKKDRPRRGKVLACRNCTGPLRGIPVKSPGDKSHCILFYPVTFLTQTKGAEFQDRLYGPGLRLHNPLFANKTLKHIGWACTVCGERKLI